MGVKIKPSDVFKFKLLCFRHYGQLSPYVIMYCCSSSLYLLDVFDDVKAMTMVSLG